MLKKPLRTYMLTGFDEISIKFCELMSDDEMAKLLEDGAWEIERKLEVAAEALFLPPWDADVTKLSGGEALSCCIM